MLKYKKTLVDGRVQGKGGMKVCLLFLTLLQTAFCSQKRVYFEKEYALPVLEVSDFAAAESLQYRLLFDIQDEFDLRDDLPSNDQVMAFLIGTRDFDGLRELFAETPVSMKFGPEVLSVLQDEEVQRDFFAEFPELYSNDFLCILAQNYEKYSNQLVEICTGHGNHACIENISVISESINSDVYKLDFFWKLMITETQEDLMNPPAFIKRIKTCAREFISCYNGIAEKSAQIKNFMFKLAAVPKAVQRIIFVEAIQMGSVEILEAVNSKGQIKVNEIFANGTIMGNALIHVINDAVMLKKLLDLGADLNSLVNFPRGKSMSVITWLLLQNDPQMNELIYSLNLPEEAYNQLLQDSIKYSLPRLQDYVCAECPLIQENLESFPSVVGSATVATYDLFDTASDDPELQRHLQMLRERFQMSQLPNDQDIYLNAIRIANWVIVAKAAKLEIPLAIDNYLSDALKQALITEGIDYFVNVLKADPRLLQLNVFTMLKANPTAFAVLFLIAPETCIAHLNWIKSAFRNQKDYLQFLLLVMMNYAAEGGDAVVEGISQAFVAALKASNLPKIPSSVFEVRPIFKQAIVLAAEAADFAALRDAMIENLSKKSDEASTKLEEVDLK